MSKHDGDITPGMNSYYGEIDQMTKPPIEQKHKWGSRGVRYDEQCAGCGRETDIDNDTELCVQCASK